MTSRLPPTLVRHAPWPHAIAFAAAHPGAKPALATFFDDESGRLEVDVPAGRVRLRLDAESARRMQRALTPD